MLDSCHYKIVVWCVYQLKTHTVCHPGGSKYLGFLLCPSDGICGIKEESGSALIEFEKDCQWLRLNQEVLCLLSLIVELH